MNKVEINRITKQANLFKVRVISRDQDGKVTEYKRQ